MKIDILDVKIDALPKDQLLQEILNQVRAKQLFLVTPYSEFLVMAQQDGNFRDILNAADYSLPDGIGILWAAKFLSLEVNSVRPKIASFFAVLWELTYSLLAIVMNPKFIRNPIPEKISGAEFVWDLAEMAAANGYSVYLLGGFGDTPKLAAEKLKSRFPHLKLAGTYTGDPEEQGIVEKINLSGADFLFTAFGPQRQEEWLAKNRKNLNIKLMIGLGGTFDYLAHKRPLAPNFWAFRGLEWLWRLLTQPWRVGRIAKGVLGLICYCFLFRLRKI